MAYTQPSGSFLHACAYSSLLLAVSREMFPTQPFFDLPPDKRRIVDLETGNLLLQSRWKCTPRNSRPSSRNHKLVAKRPQRELCSGSSRPRRHKPSRAAICDPPPRGDA